MSRPRPPTFLARVTDALPHLHPSERKLGELVLNFPGEMGGYTATEIAELGGVSSATVSRFVRRIGYASFEEARRAVRDEQASGTGLLRFSSKTGNEDGSIAQHREMSLRNLDATYAALDDAIVDSLAHAMIAAPRVWFIGFRAGQAFAQYLGWQSSQVLANVSVLPRAGETLAESIVSLTGHDVVVLLALRRTPKLALATAQATREADAKLARLYEAIASGVLDASEPTLKGQIDAATRARDRAKAEIDCIAARTKPTAAPTKDQIAAFTDLLRSRLRDGDPLMRRRYLREVIDRVEVKKHSARIVGRIDRLEATLAGNGHTNTPGAVQRFVRTWRAGEDESGHWRLAVAV